MAGIGRPPLSFMPCAARGFQVPVQHVQESCGTNPQVVWRAYDWKFELRQSSNGQFYFSLKASNGEPILASEMYQSKAGAEHGLQSVKTPCAH
jgi:uncharacterized protein YegP (UPF0339 family)